MIEHPFLVAEADADTVSTFFALPEEQRVGTYWQSGNCDAFKAHAKQYYIGEQNYRCCYCNKQIDTDNHAVWDLEHVLSRDNYPQYIFEPLNLSISCKDCNIAKSNKTVTVSLEYKKFPKRSSSYLIAHPHFDELDDHIGLHAGLVYYPRNGSKKGIFTIQVCNLTRYAELYDERKGPVCDKRYEADVAQLMFSQNRADAVVAMKKILTAFEADEI
ncbi:hypothetical protein [Mesorhizobium sp. M0030]|uniref:HNH endonuclease n=1 Tax=Mesorhizobium sp. M0030 TaxID=2956851 RepID=UPI00333ABC1F